jgi:hypothetical protein
VSGATAAAAAPESIAAQSGVSTEVIIALPSHRIAATAALPLAWSSTALTALVLADDWQTYVTVELERRAKLARYMAFGEEG